MATIKTLLGYVKGPKGDTGETGGTGPAGAAATISVGTTTQVASTLPAEVTNVGTASAAVLNFKIPEGRPGSVGEISGYAVNSITTQQGNFPTPVVGDTIATIVGKQAKATSDAQAGIQTARSDASDALDAATAASASIANVLGDFADVEATATASKAYEVGDYLVLNEQFYKVTAAIAHGNALTVGGNIEATNVGAEVTTLNNDLANGMVTWNTLATGVTYTKHRGILYIGFAGGITLQKNAWTQIGVLPDGFRPRLSSYSICGDGASDVTLIQVLDNGTVSAKPFNGIYAFGTFISPL